jgi:hypothetical protein
MNSRNYRTIEDPPLPMIGVGLLEMLHLDIGIHDRYS